MPSHSSPLVNVLRFWKILFIPVNSFIVVHIDGINDILGDCDVKIGNMEIQYKQKVNGKIEERKMTESNARCQIN